MADESSTNAVLEQEAEVTSGESLTPTETSTTVKDGETKPAEKPPAKEKSSQEAPTPDESEDDKLPFNKHPRWIKVYGENKEMKGVLSGLEELGIKSKEDAEFLLKDVDEAREEGLQLGRNQLTRWITEDPQRFREDLYKKHPEVFAEIVHGDVIAFANAIAGVNRELADQIAEAARDYFGGTHQNGPRAPKSSERDALQAEWQSVEYEKQEVFDEQAKAEISTVFRSKLTELTKGLAFQSDKQRSRFNANMFKAAAEALDRNPVFARQYDRLGDIRGLSRSQLAERKREIVALHLRYATDPAFLRRLIDEEREVMGVRISEKRPNGESRTEVTSSGAPVNGKLTQSEKDRKYEELSQKYDGNLLAIKWAEWLAGDR